MSVNPSRPYADQQWVESMFADLQRQVDELSGQLHALTHLVHIHTLQALGEPPQEAGPTSTPHGEGSDG
jgi:hypothetical protein